MDSASKELLEKAARNCSIEVHWLDKYDSGLTDEFLVDHPRPHFIQMTYPYKEWNPLVSDEDAFDLMVKEKLTVRMKDDYVIVCTQKNKLRRFRENYDRHKTEDDAVRFCIVRFVANKE